MQQCQDNFYETFGSYLQILDCHQEQAKNSQWKRCSVSSLNVQPLDEDSPLINDVSAFAEGTTQDAIDDTVLGLGLAIRVDGELYPIRDTAYKSLLDRAKISGSVLPKLSRKTLADVLNECLHMFSSDALVLIRDEKVSAVHSGDVRDYSILPIDELLAVLKKKLDERFPGGEFKEGYRDHSITSATFTFPRQREELLETYINLLAAKGQKNIADKLMPGIRFITSDTGVASARVSAMIMGKQFPIRIGDCVAVDHRCQKKVEDFENALDQLFAQFSDNVKKLNELMSLELEFPVNAMTRVCKKLAMPKKAAMEAIAMFEMANGGVSATAHDVFMAMQEIMFILKTQNTPQSKMLAVEENMARALFMDWKSFDLAKGVDY